MQRIYCLLLNEGFRCNCIKADKYVIVVLCVSDQVKWSICDVIFVLKEKDEITILLIVYLFKLYWLDIFLLYQVKDHVIVFLVSYSCWVTIRNSNYCKRGFNRRRHEKWLERRVVLLFVNNVVVVLGFWQCRTNTI